MTETVLAIVLAVLASTGFWTLINNLIANRKSKKSSTTKALLSLLHDRVYALCREYIAKGYITVEELENLNYLYEPYKDMGGNGTCKKLIEEVGKLPIREED